MRMCPFSMNVVSKIGVPLSLPLLPHYHNSFPTNPLSLSPPSGWIWMCAVWAPLKAPSRPLVLVGAPTAGYNGQQGYQQQAYQQQRPQQYQNYGATQQGQSAFQKQ